MTNLDFARIEDDKALRLERQFEEEEVQKAVFDLGSDKSSGPDGFPIAFFQFFWNEMKDKILEFYK